MTSRDVSDVVAILKREMLIDCDPADFDLGVDDETGAIELSTDEWTLQIENISKTPVAWFAIDNEPETPDEYAMARHAVVRSVEEAALKRANNALDRLIAHALEASGDAFSHHIAQTLGGIAE